MTHLDCFRKNWKVAHIANSLSGTPTNLSARMKILQRCDKLTNMLVQIFTQTLKKLTENHKSSSNNNKNNYLDYYCYIKVISQWWHLAERNSTLASGRKTPLYFKSNMNRALWNISQFCNFQKARWLFARCKQSVWVMIIVYRFSYHIICAI